MTSYWLRTTPRGEYPALRDDLTADVVVVGGGIAGLCTAWELARAGRRVVVLEAGRIAEASTGNTTAKVTALHGAKYADLGDRAALYAQSQADALARMAAAARTLGADCEWETRDAYTYAVDDDAAQSLEREARAAAEAGLPATFVTTTPLPYPVAGAVRVSGQAQFHPRKFLLALTEDLIRLGARVFEDSRVVEFAEGHVKVTSGAGVSAPDVVITTGFPVWDRPELFARLTTKRELVVAAAIPASADPGGMFLGVDDDRSVRTAPYEGGQRLLIVTGETYKPGEAGVDERYARLTEWMTTHFPVASADFRWSAQDYTATDGVPFVGPYPGHDHVWVATGFGAWGMTNAMMAGALLTARITGDAEPPWAGLYDPRRLHPLKEAPSLARNAFTVTKNLVGERIGSPDTTVDKLAPGQGAVVSVDGTRTAAFRDDDGELHLVSATCTHQGCVVGFNDAERTWDCPCHGSRFGVDGEVLQGPAISALKPVTPKA